MKKEQHTMKSQPKLLAVFTLIALAAIPALGQMPKNTMTCCMGGMGKSMSVAQKKTMGKCCMGGMKTAGMKPGDMKMGKTMSNLSDAEKKKMGKCCMVGMKPGSKGMPGGMSGKK